MKALIHMRRSVLCLLCLLCASALLTPSVASAQDEEDGSKGIVSEEVIVKRKAKTSVQRKRRYRFSGKRPTAPATTGQEDVRLGLTIFRYEPSGAVYKEGGDKTKNILMEGTEDAPTPPKEIANWNVADWARATPDDQFAVGQAVRLHFEPLTQARYLYIVHQELYADGSTGQAQLLFPTLRTNNGNNLIAQNDDLWIPRAPAFFRIKPSASNKDHVGELITVILRTQAPKEILPRALENAPLKLSAADLARLTGGASGAVVSMNLEGGAGQKQTAQEMSKDLGMEGEEAPTEDDPLPQTVYEARVRTGQPVVFRIPLRFRAK
jgi:hypothetical protein